MGHERTPINKFVKTSWTNLNIRCGKYKHLQTVNKCKVYQDKTVEFTREEYKEWCYNQKDYILSLERPSLDRIDSNGNYTLTNIRIIELIKNIQRKRYGNVYHGGPKENTVRGIRQRHGKWQARITINFKETHLGMFQTEDEAKAAFKNAYFQHYNKYPW